MPLTISSPAVFADQPDTVFSSNQPLKASRITQLSHNAKYGAVRAETILMGFFTVGNSVGLPVSPVDGYAYSQAEVQYSARLYSPRAPAAGFTPGQKTPPSLNPAQSGNLYYFAADVDDSTGLVSDITSNYVQGGAETVTFAGTVKVYALCQRMDVSVQGGALQQSTPLTLTPPGGDDPWLLTADLEGNLNLYFNIPPGVDYRFGQLNLLADLEKTRTSTTLAAPAAATDTTIQVASSAGFLVGDYVDFQMEVVQILGPGSVGSVPNSNTWSVARAQALTTAGTGTTGNLVCRLTALSALAFALPAGLTLDNPSTPQNPYYQIVFRPGRMRISYAVLQLFSETAGTGQLEQSFEQFAYEPVVPNTMPGLRAADGTYGLIEVLGSLAVGNPAATQLSFPPDAACTIGQIYATVDKGSQTGAPILGQLYIQAPQIGDGVSTYALGPQFTIALFENSSGTFFSGAQLGSVQGAVITLAVQQVGSTTPGSNLRVYITF